MLAPPALAPDETARRSVSRDEPFKGDAISMHDQTRWAESPELNAPITERLRRRVKGLTAEFAVYLCFS
jgi:hypothetical protein